MVGMSVHSSQFAESGPGNRLFETHDRASLDATCEMAVRLFDMTAAALILVKDKTARLIGGHNLPVKMRTIAWDAPKAPYSEEQRYVLTNAENNSFAQFAFHEAGLPDVGSLLRTPVLQTPTYLVSLMVFGSTQISKPTAKKIKLLDDIVALAQTGIKQIADILADPENDVTVPLTLPEVITKIDAASYAVSLLDSNLRIIATNAHVAKMLGVDAGNLLGMSQYEIDAPSADAVNFLYRQALATMQSPPDFEVIINQKDNVGERIYKLQVTPFSPSDTRDYFLLVLAQDVTSLAHRIHKLSDAIDSDHGVARPADPSQLFLMDTLVKRRSIRQRKNVNFLTLRSWREPIREYQIKALKALKQNITPDLPKAIADELKIEIENLFGKAAFKAIVPMPCGHSRADSCLSLEIARALGLEFSLPVIQAFIPQRAKGVSHPKNNLKRLPLALARIIEEPVLLVDDVATSGAHIEEAVGLLKPTCRAVMAIAWIGGNVAGEA
jgi:predicted amidophosphoribosyltransferase/PAS domain-containing protein